MSVEVTGNKDWFSNKGTALKLFEQLLLFVDKETLGNSVETTALSKEKAITIIKKTLQKATAFWSVFNLYKE